MKLHQRQIVEVSFNLPQGPEVHPVIILSDDETIEDEEAFVAVMITSELKNDIHSFLLEEHMLSKQLSEESEVRLHLISFFSYRDVIQNNYYNIKVKEPFFKEIIEEINDKTFGYRIKLEI